MSKNFEPSSRHGMKEPQQLVDDTVPGRPSGAELRAMALRQQQQIESQQQLLAAKEQRLRFLKAQEVRGAAAAAEGERLRRLRERVEAQESKLRRLRALRGQVDLQKTYNVTLSNDLDSIRALFSEKEKELSLAVAKVEALTRQLEDVRRDRRAPLALIPGSGGVGSSGNSGNATTSPAALELDKLRRELMYRNQLSLQQDARLHLQREALQQRQAELRSVDQRILELQNRLHKKKSAAGVPLNLHPQYQSAQGQLQQLQHQQQQQLQQYHQQQQQHQQQQHQLLAAQQQQAIQLLRPSNSVYPSQRVIPRGNVAAVEPYMHTPQKQSLKTTNQQLHHQQQQQQLHHLQQQQQPQHHPQLHQQSNLKKPTSQHQLIHDLTNLKLNLQPTQQQPLQQVQHAVVAESDESKLAARHQKHHHQPPPQASPQYPQQHFRQGSKDSADSADAKFAGHQPGGLPYAKYGLSKSASSGAIPAGYQQQHHQHQLEASSVSPSATSVRSNESDSEKFNGNATADSDSSGPARVPKSRPHNGNGNGSSNSKHSNTTVHSTPLNGANKSLAIAATASTPSSQVPQPASATQSAAAAAALSAPITPKPIIRPKGQPIGTHKLHPGNLAVPPRKPISSVAPTTIVTPPKIIAHSPKVHMVAPTNLLATPIMTTSSSSSTADTTTATAIAAASFHRPALPPKPPGKQSPTTAASVDFADSGASSAPTVVSVISKPPMSEPAESSSSSPSASSATDNLPIIKARPLTIKKQPLSEQPPKLRTGGVGGNSAQIAAAAATNGGLGSALGGPKQPPMQYSRRIEMPPASLFPEIEKTNLKAAAPSSTAAQISAGAESGGESSSTATGVDDTDRSSVATSNDDDGPHHHQHMSVSAAHEVVRRTRSNLAISGGGGKVKLARRVSFDPLALLLDASLEGELELVRKTTMQVTNPSAANDEGITALHNAICAGHFAIVKFLVEYGCDVNAQDSDGWTPLHCAASCNNLEMVKFLVESGACLFAATLSDHETPAEKCEEDEEGFDGCSEYLYSIQEKLGILNSGEVYAVFSYDSQQPDELCFGVNDRLVILRKGDDAEREWWWARLENSGHEGYVPRNLLGLYPRILLQHSLD